jgi:hypothetical protein
MSSVSITFLPPDQDMHPDDDVEWQDGRLMRRDLAPGTSQWSRGLDGKIASLMFVCPCGCGSVGAVTVREGYGMKQWHWNGDEARPTLTPSILKTSPCRWHGFLTDGAFVSC